MGRCPGAGKKRQPRATCHCPFGAKDLGGHFRSGPESSTKYDTTVRVSPETRRSNFPKPRRDGSIKPGAQAPGPEDKNPPSPEGAAAGRILGAVPRSCDQPLIHISRLGFATPEMRADRIGIAASETTRRPRGLRNEIVSGLGRLYGTSETRPAAEVPERLGDSASCPRNRHPLPSRDRSVETTQTRYDTLGRPRGRRVVSGAAMSLRSSPTSGVATPERRCVEGYEIASGGCRPFGTVDIAGFC